MNSDIAISISVVSHGQMHLVAKLLDDIQQHCSDHRLEVLLTLNVAENVGFEADRYTFPVRVLRNPQPLGFGANHNQAFRHSTGAYFCVVNPDIRFHHDPLHPLVSALGVSQVGVVAPRVVGPTGEPEDSARPFPTPRSILRRAITGKHIAQRGRADESFSPHWVGGMFMVFPRQIFVQVGGFDERYFLYYEDVDLCGRLRLLGWRALVCPAATVVHAAQRNSHRSLRYFRWHAVSLIRFFTSATFRRLWARGYL